MSEMSPEEVRLECLSLAVECREARHSAADVVALAAAFECFVNLPAAPADVRSPAASVDVRSPAAPVDVRSPAAPAGGDLPAAPAGAKEPTRPLAKAPARKIAAKAASARAADEALRDMRDKSAPTLLAGSGARAPEVAGPADIAAGDFTDRLFDRYLERLKPREGKTWLDPNPRAGLTYKGVTQKTIDDLRALPGGRWSDLPKSPTDLGDEQIREIYREEYFDRSRAAVVAAMPGVIEATPELPEQLFDSSVQHSPMAAGRFLQQALEETVGREDLRDSKTGRYTGNIGPNTQAALREAIAEGKLDDVNDRMADIRLEATKNGWSYKNRPDQRKGLEARVLSFKTSRRSKPRPGG